MTSGLYPLNEDQIAERGARLARRDDREYREYLREEQRRQTGCPAREVVLDQRIQATRRWLLTVAASATFAVSSVQAVRDAEPTTTRHLSVITSTSAGTVSPGGRVSLVVEITPKPDMHVYAPGQTDVIPVSLTLVPSDAAVSQPLQFPKAEKLEIKELGETHLVYSKPFRLVQDVTVPASRSLVKRAATSGATLTVKGTLKYQACDNAICYAPVSVPVSWTLALQNAPSNGSKKPQR